MYWRWRENKKHGSNHHNICGNLAKVKCQKESKKKHTNKQQLHKNNVFAFLLFISPLPVCRVRRKHIGMLGIVVWPSVVINLLGLGKQSRSIFMEIDAKASASPQTTPSSPAPTLGKRINPVWPPEHNENVRHITQNERVINFPTSMKLALIHFAHKMHFAFTDFLTVFSIP